MLYSLFSPLAALSEIYLSEPGFRRWAMKPDQLVDPGEVLRAFQGYVRSLNQVGAAEGGGK